ncbi:phosphoserine aminotransferase [Halteromyces radiatus]|uniref:phosphoserine aminotransferase n=1 Tax=Halteromyces radiatus TaxID=101107 RepID=UPI00221FCD5D|nr:phosphoserine aminotransferase [Halteromyces radiatus]KAI8093404.1 phosphoserine aminotransferase [Halteromyces radiatus]
MSTPYVLNFGAGPAKIPKSVLERAQSEMLNYDNSGMSVMELSHRSKTFSKILEGTKSKLKSLMEIPDNYDILFMQGGATTQFAAVFYNLVAAKQSKNGNTDDEVIVDYIVSGAWSNKAVQEAERLAKNERSKITVHRVTDSKKQFGKYGSLAAQDTWQLSDPNKTAYVYYCDNETVHGVEFPTIPEVDPSVPLVADVSSNFLSRRLDVSKFGVIYGGAQKNLGPAGVSIVIIRKDLLVDLNIGPVRPLMLDFSTMANNDSMYNTPPTFAIYMVGLVLEWIMEQGGLPAIEERNKRKADKLYKVIDQSKLYRSPVDVNCRSRMNVVFRLASEELEQAFLTGVAERNMVQLKGHRSVGGIRASIYNSMPEQDVDLLIAYMIEFEKTHTANE